MSFVVEERYWKEIADFLADSNGPVLLHISDTATWQYRFLQKLLATVKPNRIIHTGDCADEFKVGRLEADRKGYEAGLKELMKVLRTAKCPITFTHGNNDDLVLLEGEENVEVLQNYTTLELFGIKLLIDHYPFVDAGDVDFALYGHSARFDMHYPPNDTGVGPVYLNGNFFWTVIDCATKRYLSIPVIEPLVFDDKIETDENGDKVIIRTEKDRQWKLPPKERWFLTQMHLHAGVEDFSSVRSHAKVAKEIGYDVIFITEHDNRMNRVPNCIETFCLTAEGDAVRADGKAGWYRDDGAPALSVANGDGYSLCLKKKENATFKSVGKKHQVSLFADVTVTLKISAPKNADILVDFTLSQRPEDLEQQHLYYGIGEASHDGWFKTVECTEDGVYTFKISDDVLCFDPDFGQDNALLYITVTAVSDEITVDSIEFDRKYVAEDVRKRQKTLSKVIGPKYKIVINSGFEMSFGHHQNCFSAHVPVVDYGKTGYVKSDETGAKYLQSRGATFAYNHMFSELKNTSPEEHEKAIQSIVELGLETRFGGAQLIEVGFPEGRYGFSIGEHMRVWDELAMKGLKMVGYGDSDSHNSKVGWLDGNNFGSWILSRDRTQETLERAMRKGKICLGNPVRWKSTWDFAIGDATIGDTLKCDDEALGHIKLNKLTEPVIVKIIRAGKILEQHTVTDACFESEFAVDRGSLDCCPVRVEVWSNEAEPKPLFFTNPIYLEK